MIKAEFDTGKLQQYIFLLHEIVETSITVYDSQFVPIVETDHTDDQTARIKIIKEKLPETKNTPSLWFAPDGTAEIAVRISYKQNAFAYAWIGNLYYEPRTNPHEKLKKNGLPVYDNQSIHNILGLIQGGVELFVCDLYEVDPDLQNRIDRYISDNLDKKINLKTLSAALDADIAVVRNFFADDARCDLNAYLREKRIEKAKHLLTETDLPFAEIAERIGLSEGRFNELFRKAVLVTPKEYRKNGRN